MIYGLVTIINKGRKNLLFGTNTLLLDYMRLNLQRLGKSLFVFLFYFTSLLNAQEGTKQFMPNASDRLWLEIYRSTDKLFATYAATDKERLYIYLNAGETMHFGMKMASYSGANVDYIKFRIKDEGGSVVYTETDLPQTGSGYISSYDAAVKGPNGLVLNGTTISGGYSALSYTAATSGNHYIEFSSKEWNWYSGSWHFDEGQRFALEFFDVTVTDASNNVVTNPGNPNVSAGRLWSKGWAFTTTSFYDYPVKTDFYVFTADEFVNKVQYEMKPYSFNFVANSYGVSVDVNDNVIEKAQSQDGDLTNTSDISEYRIFLNDPDRGVWQNTALPPPTVQVWFDDDLLYDYDYDRDPQELTFPSSTILLEKNNVTCPYNSVTMFKIVSNIDGFATIMLDLDGGGYSTAGNDRALELPLVQGENYVLWDFKDDSGNEVSDGSYTASGTFLGRGPAHFPLYDVESLSGISTYSIRPFNKLGPTLYWDDTQTAEWGDQGSGTMSETAQKQLTINNHIPRVWTYNGNNYNGNGTTLNSWFNAIDLGMSVINFDVVTSGTKCVNGEAPVIGDVNIIGAIDEVLTFSLSDFTDKYYDPNDLPLVKIQVLELPSQGELRLSGVLVTDDQEILAADIANLTYTPPSGFGGTIPFEYKASSADNYSLQSNYVNLISNSAPTIAAIADQTICTNDGLVNQAITVGDAETAAADLTVIAYSHDPDFVANNNIEVTGTGATRYLNVTPVNDESGFAIIYLLVDDGHSQTIEEFALHVGPSVVVSGDLSVCVGGDLLLTAEEVGASYVWQKGGTTLSTTGQLSIPSVTLGDAGLYSLTVSKESCVTTKDFMVSIAPAVSFTGDVDLCVGESISLSADETVATTYSWRRGGTEIGDQKVFNQANLTLADAGNDYTLYVEKEGCANTSAPFSITVVQMLDANISVSSNDVIAGNDATITLSSAEQNIVYTIYDSGDNAVATGSNSTVGDDLVLTVSSGNLVTGTNTFRIEGNNGNCTVELNNTVSLNVNSIPTVSALTISTDEDIAYNGNVLTGASDDDGGSMTAALATGGDPANGSVTINSDGSFTYTPDLNYYGSDSFTFEVCDNQSPNACVTADVTVTVVAQNDAPTLSTDTKVLTEDNTLMFAASDFTDLFDDVDGDVLSQLRIDAVPNASTGVLQLSGSTIGNGQIISAAQLSNLTFVPANNWNGSTSFSWSASDGTLWSASGVTMSLTVSAEDDEPSVANASASVNEDASNGASVINLNDQLTGTDFDIDGEAITYSVFSGNTGSVFTIHPTSGLITVNNTSGIDFETLDQYSLVIRSTDTQGSFSDATITIDIINTDTDVVLTIADQSLTEGNTGTSNMTFTISSSAIVAADLTVNFIVSDITAAHPADYTVNSGSATISAGTNSTTINIPVVGDAIVESTETFRLDLNSPSSGSVSGFATGTINDNDNASLTISNATANEGDGSVEFSVTLNGTVASAFDVDYALSNGSATGGSDFNASAGTINFTGTNGQTRTISVPITDDAVVENTESFGISLSTTNVAIDATDTATGTINDNDGSATLSIANISFNENASGTFRVTVDKAVQGGFDVGYSFVNGTAIAGTDFSNSTSALSFTGTAGEYEEFTVAGLDDAIVEGTEQFTINLNSASGLVDAGASATGSIIDDDAVNVTIDDVSASEGGSANFTITLNNAVVGGTVITYSFTDISATGGSDYNNTSGTVTFAGTANETKSFSVALTDDNNVETDESFEVSLSSSNVLVGADDKATVTINDNDGTAMVSVSDITIDENQNATFTLVLDKNVQGGFVVDYSTENGTANAGTDYVAQSSNVNFTGNAGESHAVTIVVNDDNIVETAENLLVNFSCANALVNTTAQAQASINDNDGLATLSIANVTFDENGSGTFSVTVNKAVQGGFDVTNGFTSGTAISGTDFDNSTQTLSFNGSANQTLTFNVAAVDDAIVENSESFTVTLSTANALVDATATAIGTINDNDAANISVGDINISEGNNAVFSLQLSAAVAGGVTVNYTLEGISASPVNDYSDLSDQVSFVGNANEIVTITILTVDDAVVEATESFRLRLTISNTLVTLDNQAIANITDNDGRAKVSVNDISVSEGANAVLTLSLDKAVQDGFSINHSTSAVTALAVSDFASSTGSTSFVGTLGETQTITITLNDDNVVESDELFTIDLSTIHALVDVDASAQVTIQDNDGIGTLSTSNITFDEDGSGSFDVTVDKAVQGGFTVAYAFTDGTALEGIDFNGVGTSINFNGTAGQTQSFTVNAIDDNIVEGPESFTATLSTISPLVDASASASGTITDNDIAAVSVVDVNIIEGEDVVFTMELNKDVVGGFEVDYYLSGLTATSDVDYADVSDKVIFTGTEGEQRTVTISTADDNSVESAETFRLNMSTVHTLVNVQASALATIADNDGTANVSINDISITEGDDAVLTLTLDKNVQGGVTISYSTADATANAGSDFNNTISSVSFAGTSGETQTVSITIIDDSVIEGAEAFNVLISSANALVTTSGTGEVSVADNDGTATLIVDNITVSEGGSSNITLSIDKEVQGSVDINYSMTDLTATAGDDYDASAGVVTLTGTDSRIIEMTAMQDVLVEGNEQFTVAYSASSLLVDASAESTVTIIDDDTANLLVADASASEGDNLSFTVSLSQEVLGGVDVTYNLTAVDASADTDYTDVSGGVLNFVGTAGETQTFDVPLASDLLVESSETFIVSLSSSNALVGADDTATGTILDTNGRAGITISDIIIDEDENAVFEVILDKAVQGGVVVNYSSADGTAGAASDYTSKIDVLNFAGIVAGESQFITIDVNDDLLVETVENFSVNLSTAHSLVDVDATAMATINDNDGDVTLSVNTISFQEDGDATVTVSSDKAIQGGFDVDYTFVGVTATADLDFEDTPGTLNFVGSLNEEQSFTVRGIDDSILEGNETFQITFTSSNSLVDASVVSSGTITDNDVTVVTVDEITITEGANAIFTLTLSDEVVGGFDLDYSLLAATATANVDYTDASGQVSFIGTAGEQQTVEVTITDDAIVETSETFSLVLSSANIAITPDSETLATITDNDGTAAVSVLAVTINEGEEAILSLELDKAVQGGFGININTADVTALAGSDYTALIDVVTFVGAAGETQEVRISTSDDAIVETQESLSLALLSANTLVVPTASVDISIIDNDGLVNLSLDNVSVQEDGEAVVTVSADKAIQGGFDVDYSFINGTATAGLDFEDTPGTLNFSGLMGEEQTITVKAIDDAILEGEETFQIGLTTTNALVDASALSSSSITDNDVTVVTVDEITVVEGNKAIFTLTLSDMVMGGFNLDYSLLAGTATLNDDYTDLNAQVAFVGTAGEQQVIEVITIDDAIVEADETFSLVLSSSNIAIEPDAETMATISDNDGAASITVEEVTVNEGEEAVLTLVSDKAVEGGFDINISTTDNTASSVTDYTALVDVVSFTGTAGETQEVRVATTDDNVVESQESFSLNLTSANTLVVPEPSVNININDNDDVAKLIVGDIAVTEGGLQFVNLWLDKAVEGGVTINLSVVEGTASASDISLSTNSVVINGTEIKTVNLTAIEDYIVEGNETLEIHYSSGSDKVDVSGITEVLITDLDMTFVSISDVSVEEGETATMEVTLIGEVANAFTVDYVITDGTTSVDLDYTASNGTLNFEGNAGEVQSFDILTIDDALLEGSEELSIALISSNAAVDASATSTLTIEDNEEGGWTVTATDDITITSEAGISDDITLVLDTKPNSDVVIDVTGLDATEGSLSATSFTFTTDNWDTEQTLTITGVDDTEVDGNISYDLTIAVNNASSDADFHNLTTTLTVQNNDNDVLNPVPVLTDDVATTTEDTGIDIDVLANDSGLDDTPITVILVAQPTNALVTRNADNSFNVVPYANYYGDVTFEYQVCDSGDDCATATVTVSVTSVNDTPEIGGTFALTLEQGETATGQNLKSTATDVEDDVLTLNTVPTPAPAHGDVQINTDGTWSYTADSDYEGTDFFDFTICDDGTPQECVTARVNITITAQVVENIAPEANDDAYQTGRNELLSGQNLLDNDTDADGDNLSINVLPIANTLNGDLTIHQDGTFNYTPDKDYTGEDSFTYQVCDNASDSKCSVATVTITVIVKDTDGDTIADDIEGDDDVDGDGDPNYLDLDSDGDGLSDEEEGLGDCDEDGIYDFLDADQCFDDELPLSKGFSPNNDGINDTYVIPWLGEYTAVSLEVFNRWGNVVFKRDIYENDWDGKANVGMTIGDELPVGTYFYIITIAETNQQLNGYIYLNR